MSDTKHSAKILKVSTLHFWKNCFFNWVCSVLSVRPHGLKYCIILTFFEHLQRVEYLLSNVPKWLIFYNNIGEARQHFMTRVKVNGVKKQLIGAFIKFSCNFMYYHHRHVLKLQPERWTQPLKKSMALGHSYVKLVDI